MVNTEETPRLGPAPRPGTLPALTGIRFVAAMVVVLYHLAPRAGPPGALGMRLVDGGYVGVSLFFVLSGFILAYSYVTDTGALRGSRAAFWAARVARVYPAYLFALLVALPGYVMSQLLAPGGPRPGAWPAAVLAPVLLQSWWPPSACSWNCPGWSLSVEALFYAVFPLLASWLARRGPGRALGAGLIAWAAAMAVALAYVLLRPEEAAAWWLVALKYDPLVHLGEFTLGVATGLRFLEDRRRMAPAWVSAAAPTALLAAAAVAAVRSATLYPVLHTGFLAPLFALALYSLAFGRGWLSRLLGTRPLVRLGEASYALYLLHTQVGAYLHAVVKRTGLLAGAPLVQLLLAVTLSIVLAWLTFRHVEEPARRYIQRRARELLAGAATPREGSQAPVLRADGG